VAWIKTIDERDADGALKRLYDEQHRQAGAVASILKIHSLAPEVLMAHLAIYHAAMHAPGELSRAQREMIAVAVSSANGCHY
jgi:alkylhydroperoxidase family enzyme